MTWAQMEGGVLPNTGSSSSSSPSRVADRAEALLQPMLLLQRHVPYFQPDANTYLAILMAWAKNATDCKDKNMKSSAYQRGHGYQSSIPIVRIRT